MVHHLQIVGEAAARLPQEMRNACPHVPWKQIVGLRDILVHAYFRVDLDEVWVVIDRDIPALKEELTTLLPMLTDTNSSGQHSASSAGSTASGKKR